MKRQTITGNEGQALSTIVLDLLLTQRVHTRSSIKRFVYCQGTITPNVGQKLAEGGRRWPELDGIG